MTTMFKTLRALALVAAATAVRAIAISGLESVISR
jgi:hypothetical protein